jgi:hypothetical protein
VSWTALLSHLGRKLRALGASIKQNCPPELEACESCGELECSTERWRNCEYRKLIQELIEHQGTNTKADR